MTASGTHQSARRRWLCIAYSFPPINRSGTHRTLAFVRHLAAHGWDASVITVEPTGESIDQQLQSLVPSTVDVTRTACPNLTARIKQRTGLDRLRRSAKPIGLKSDTSEDASPVRRRRRRGLSEWASRLLQTPDAHLGWYGPGRRAGGTVLQNKPYDLIYSTSPCMTAHLIARRLSRSFGIPWVADFRDPWGDNPYRELPFASLAWWDGVLERRVLRDAARVICNTMAMRESLCERLPFVRDKSTVILNGYDAERMEDVTPVRMSSDGEFVLTHAGQFYGKRSPLPLFRALHRTIHTHNVSDRPIRLMLVGPDCYDGTSLSELARRHGVAAHVTVTGPKSHREALSLLAGSDAVVLQGTMGPGSDLQMPNKLFEYLALRRPILAAVSAINPEVEILEAANANYKLASPDDPKSLAMAMRRLACPSRMLQSNAWSGVGCFDRVHRAAELLDVFEHAAGRMADPAVMASKPRESIRHAVNDALAEDRNPVPTIA